MRLFWIFRRSYVFGDACFKKIFVRGQICFGADGKVREKITERGGGKAAALTFFARKIKKLRECVKFFGGVI